tara:strand:+ start:30288 stop:30545 length:258 start_codon:yes stop_codon:yes gene_type:complete
MSGCSVLNGKKHFVMSDRKLLITGLVGSIATALCCFTPLLIILAGFAGIMVLPFWLDYLLLPALLSFLILTGFMLWRMAFKNHQR